MEAFLRDLRHSLRMFRQSPSFTIAAVAALALGIGANTAIFSVVNAVLLKPVPFPDPDRLVMFMNTSPQGSGPAASPAKFAHYRRADQRRAGRLRVSDGRRQLHGRRISRAAPVRSGQRRLFPARRGIPISRGRTFTADEDRPNGERVVVLSHGLWTRRFGSDPSVIGKTISLERRSLRHHRRLEREPERPEFWSRIPTSGFRFNSIPNSTDQGHYFQALGRLKPGVTLEQAQRADASCRPMSSGGSIPNALQPNQGFSVDPFQEVLVRNVRPTLLVLVGAVSFVLLIACANVANLLLVRATGRKREIAIRAAIGAGRGRIIRQLLTESVVLSLVGGALGLALGIVGIRALLSINTAGIPRVGQDGSVVGVDWRVLGFTLLVSIGTGILFGLIPALQGSRADLSTTLKESARPFGHRVPAEQGAVAPGRRRGRARADPARRLGAADSHVAGAARRQSRLRSEQRADDAHVAVGDALHDVRAASISWFATASSGCARCRASSPPAPPAACRSKAATACRSRIVGRPLQQGPFHGGGGWLTVSPGYFDVFKIPVKRGRALHRSRRRRGAAGRHHQRADGASSSGRTAIR